MASLSVHVPALAYSFSYALLYSVPQAGLLYGVLWATLKALPAAGARVRYALSYGVLGGIVVWFVATWVQQYRAMATTIIYVTDATKGATTALTAPQHAVQVGDSTMTTILPALTDYVPYILAAYGMGLLIMIVRLARSVVRMRMLTRKGVQQPDHKWLDYMHQWQQRMGVMRQVRLLLTDRIDVPMMLGALKPVILLPIATINNLSTAQVEAILLHELAHISRHDYVLNLLQALAEAVLFFNPFVWLVSGSIRKEREHCCDDLVVAACSNPMIYATALAQLEENRINDNSLTMAATGTDNQLLNRIKRIMEMKNTTNNRQTSVAVLVAAVVAATLLMGMIAYTPTWAQEKKKEPKEVQKKTVTKTVTIDDSGTKKVVTKTATSVAATKDADTDDVRISISVSDDNGEATAKVVVVNGKTVDIVGTDGKQPTTKVMVSKSIKGVEATMEKELEEVRQQLANVDWNSVKSEMSMALAEIDKEVNIDEIVKEVTTEIKKELSKIDDEPNAAQKQTVKQRKIIRTDDAPHTDNKMEEMLNEMQEDGLLNRNKSYKVVKKEDELYINGKKQSAKVYNKYYTYFIDEEVEIKGSRNSLTIKKSNSRD